ncbi:hypothetical protein Cgig2_003520 [Carnegiea gigantea]|uniref:Uncharacterized protein n=1 Tax=Carnegiea gigantea TaxID=171969 RepID=A0A9Q1JHS0_9CARY|nr:hypothetical protein Cgig2_003520 [Carnegiea gigantea]
MAEQAAEYYELPELLQVIFYAMLLNEAEKLGVLHGPRLRSLEMTLTELCWGAFESWIWLFSDRVYEARFLPKSGSDEGTRAGRVGESSSEGAAVDDTAPEGAPRGVGWEETCLLRCIGVYAYVLSKHYLLYIMSSSSPSSGDVREGQVGPQVKGRHPQFSNILAYIDALVVAGIPQKDKYRELKKIPYAIPLFESGIPSWSSCEYSSTPSILSPEVEDGPGSRFPDPKAVTKLKRSVLEKQYLLPAEYSFVIPEPDATMNEPPAKCIARAPKETGDLGWYCFNNRSGFMTAMEKKSKLKYWKYDFLFLRRESGWGDVPDWNEGKPIRQPFGEPTAEERQTARYLMFYIHDDDRPRPIPRFMAQAIESMKEPEKRTSLRVGDARADRLVTCQSGSRSSGERTRARQGQQTPSKAAAATPDIVKSWNLVAPGASDPPKVSEEEMVMAEVFARGVEFIPPSEGGAAEDEATNPLKAEAGASEGEEHEDGGEPDV